MSRPLAGTDRRDHYAWSPITARPPLAWPDGARVAVCLIVCLEHYEWELPEGSYAPPTVPGGLGRLPFPDIPNYAHREYGNRVGIYRIMRILEKYGIRATAAVDALVAENYPTLISECRKLQWEFVAHGISPNRMITSRMSPDDESAYIRRSIDALKRSSGSTPVGWFGPEYGESEQTLELLARAGIQYVCDWPNDEQPYLMSTDSGDLVSVPLQLDLDDVSSIWLHNIGPDDYAQMVIDAFDAMYSDGGRVLFLNLHPWLIGQPFRSKYLERALHHVSQHSGVWFATGQELVDWFKGSR